MPVKPTKKAEPYPYEIPPIEYLKDRNPKNLNPWDVQELFRVEALLRSKTVMDLYRQSFSSSQKRSQLTDSLYVHYSVFPGWWVLKGRHHYLMRDQTKSKYSKVQPFHTSGISNLKTSHKLTSQTPDKGEKAFEYLKESILSENPKYLYLRIDATYSTQKIISGLRMLIAEQKILIENTSDESQWFHPEFVEDHMQGRTFIGGQRNKSKTFRRFDSSTWIDYFRCYDLRKCEAKSFGRIATKVYGDSKKYEVAEHAYKRVCTLIAYAETNNWPPPKNFLNKKIPSVPSL